MKSVRSGFLASQGGYSLIAVIVEATVLLVSFLGLYIGILYAEAQLIQDYHTRVATLLAAGEIDWQMYWLKTHSTPKQIIPPRDVVIEQYSGTSKLSGKMSLDYHIDTDHSTGDAYDYIVVEAKVTWKNPVDNKTRSVMVREDLFK